jgi:hypothetical protein
VFTTERTKMGKIVKKVSIGEMRKVTEGVLTLFTVKRRQSVNTCKHVKTDIIRSKT